MMKLLHWTLGCLLLSPVVGYGAPAVPGWVKTVEGIPTPPLPGEVPVYTLVEDTVVTIGTDGTATEQVRHAKRVLTQTGDSLALAAVAYTEKVDKLVSGTSWLVRGGKVVKSEPISKWLDLCQVQDGTVFTEQRMRTSMFPRETLSGDVFAFETVKRMPLLFAQHAVTFEEGLPIGVQRVQFVLPKGWTLRAVISGGELPEPEIDPVQNSWTWTRVKRPYLPDEPWTPRDSARLVRLLVTFTPAAGGKDLGFASTETWSDIGAWVEQLSAGQCDSDAAVAALAARVRGESGDALALIRGLSDHVQRLRYVSVAKGLGLGYGYRPRKATEVLNRGYGDCKDKVNLLRALLREVGITSHLVAVRHGWSVPTEASWPSPMQFNHAIIAIEVDASVDLPAVATIPDGRRLLFFDPTDEYTMVGDLPWPVQGGTGLLVQGAESALVAVPALPADQAWVFKTRGRLSITPEGAAEGSVDLIGLRQAGRLNRAACRSASAKDLSDRAARYMNTMLRGVVVRDPAFVDDTATGEATFRFRIVAPAVFQPAPGGRLIMRLDICNRDSVPQLGTKPRIQPVEIVPIDHVEEVVFELPSGVVVEDAPKTVTVESGYGSYSRSVEVAEGTVTLRRRMQLRQQVVPAADYEKIRGFLTEAAKADKASLVLKRAL